MRRIILILFLWICGSSAFSQDYVDFTYDNMYTNACDSLPAIFRNISNDSTNHNLLYIWDFGDGSTKTVPNNKAFVQTVKHTFAKDSIFTTTLTAIDTAGHKDSAVAPPMSHTYFKVYSPTRGSIDEKRCWADTLLTYGWTFTASFTPFKPSVWLYQWSFGDGTDTTTTSKSVFHLYKDKNLNPGYNVRLTIRLDSNQSILSNHKEAACFDTVNYTAKVDDGFFTTDTATQKVTPNIPNIFTPNKDGKNDQFVITFGDSTIDGAIKGNDIFLFKTNGEQVFTFWVYNRWGSLVYKTMGKSIVWEGKSNTGEDLASGVYYYVVQSNAPDKRHNTCGFVQLIRD